MPDTEEDGDSQYEQVEIQVHNEDDAEINQYIKEYQSRIQGTEVSLTDA